MFTPDEFKAARRAAFWAGFRRGVLQAAIVCAVVGLLAWPWLIGG